MIQSAVCPWCGEPVDAVPATSGAHADSFCATCGNPLFFQPKVPAAASVPQSDGTNGTHPAVRPLDPPTGYPLASKESADQRWPKVRGHDAVSVVDCPICGELNFDDERACHRCLEKLAAPSDAAGDTDDTVTGGSQPATGSVGQRTISVPDLVLIMLGAVLVVLVVWLLLRLF